MKEKDFVALTRQVRIAQKTYYKSRLQGDLIRSKQLETQLDKAIVAYDMDGGLEPDEPAIERLDDEGQKEYYRLINQNQIELQLDLSGSQRPTDDEGENGQ